MPSIKDEVIALVKQGYSLRQVEEKLNYKTSYAYINNVVVEARRKDKSIPYKRDRNGPPHTLSLSLPKDVRYTFAEEAKRRQISLHRLSLELLMIIAEDDMFASILDE